MRPNCVITLNSSSPSQESFLPHEQSDAPTRHPLPHLVQTAEPRRPHQHHPHRSRRLHGAARPRLASRRAHLHRPHHPLRSRSLSAAHHPALSLGHAAPALEGAQPAHRHLRSDEPRAPRPLPHPLRHRLIHLRRPVCDQLHAHGLSIRLPPKSATRPSAPSSSRSPATGARSCRSTRRASEQSSLYRSLS